MVRVHKHLKRYLRQACTLVTSTYANGTKGIPTQVYPDGVCSAEIMDEYNKKYPGQHFIMNSEATTHFMNANSTLLFFHEAIKPSLKLQRQTHGLDHHDKASITADAFSGNFAFCSGEDRRRELWCEEANSIQAARPPGGWSAKGQPCDALHMLFRKYQDAYMDAYLGYHSDHAARADLSM